MIFVTVGTHEQPFDRLIKAIDDLKANKIIEEEIIIQTGYSEYKPQYCKFNQFYSYQQMLQFVDEARIVVTHGGASSFMMPLQIGKIPIVVPRQKRYGEHINDHQVNFCKEVLKRQGNIIVVDEIEDLGDVLKNYNLLIAKIPVNIRKNNEMFCEKFGEIINEMF